MNKLVFLLLILGFFGFGCDTKNKEDKALKGTLTFAIGTIEVANSSGKKAAKKGDSVGEGDTIITGDKSTVVVEFENSIATVEIQHNSEFSINKFKESEQKLEGKKGNFWLSVKKLNKDSKFDVTTPTAVAGIRGTKIYSFEDKDAGINGICHCEGQVEFKDSRTNYSGVHNSDFLVLTKGDKTLVLTPEDFKKLGVTSDGNHNHSEIEESPIGKSKANSNKENAKKIMEYVTAKFAEK